MKFDDLVKAAKFFQPMNNALVDVAGNAAGSTLGAIGNGAKMVGNAVSDVGKSYWKGVQERAAAMERSSVKAAAPIPSAGPSPVPTSTPTPAVPTPTPRFSAIPGYTNGEVPSNFASLIDSVSKKYNVNPALLAAHLHTESGFNPSARNVSHMDNGGVSTERGAAQISDYWWPDVTDEQADNPEFAVDFLGKYLNSKMKIYNNPTFASASYNVGGQLGEGYGPNGLGPKGSEYMNKIIRNLSPEMIAEIGLLSSY